MATKGAFVIAGGSRGLSIAIAAAAIKEGFSVALIARTMADLKKAKQQLELAHVGAQIAVFKADLTNVTKTAAAFRSVLKKYGKIEVLVNNAATWTGGKTIEQLTRDDIQRSLDLNFFTAFNATKALLSSRKKSSSDELAVINIGATASLQGWNDVFAFCVAKGALRFFSQSLAREMQSKGVHVAHIVIDGMIDNPRTRRLNPGTPKNRFMEMDSIANEVLHLVGQKKSCWTFEVDLRPYNENW